MAEDLLLGYTDGREVTGFFDRICRRVSVSLPCFGSQSSGSGVSVRRQRSAPAFGSEESVMDSNSVR